jgi:predicted permease
MNNLLQDVRFAFRQLRRSPAFAFTGITVLTLAIAANVIVFGVLQALILRPLELPQPDRVMQLARTSQAYPVFSYPEVRDVRDNNSVFSSVAAYTMLSLGLEVDGVSRVGWGFEVSGEYFELAGIQPFLGRLLQPADDQPGAAQVAVLSWAAWKGSFGADPSIVGKKVRIDKQPCTIVGVAPEGFYGTEKMMQPDVFVSLVNGAALEGVNRLEQRRDWHVFAIVRLKDGVTLPQALAELNTIADRMTSRYPADEEGLGFKLVRPGFGGDFLGAPLRGFLTGLMVLAGAVLLAACANLGGLFAARTLDRSREVAIRLAVGSSRLRILRQVVVEALIISIVGGALACALAWSALTALADWRLSDVIPFRFFVRPEPSLIMMTLLTSVLAALLFGLMPLRQVFKTDPNETIKSGGNRSSAGRRWALRDMLLAAQVALCCLTLTAAFVSLRGLTQALTMDVGFNPKDGVRIQFDLGQVGYSTQGAELFRRQLLDRVSRLPGVQATGYASTTPLALHPSTTPVFSEQISDFRPSHIAFQSYVYAVSPGYFAASQTPLFAGRDISSSDTEKSAPVVVVNREFVRELFHSDEVVGLYFKNLSGRSIQIVGIVADGKHLRLNEDAEPAAFFPFSQWPDTNTSLVVRTQRDPSGAVAEETAASIRKVIADLDSAVPIQQSGAWNSQLGLVLFPSRVATVALGLFGGFGLLLSVTGTFGLASYTVGKRLRELSIRVALGAQGKQILWAALGRMLILLAGGSVVGILLGFAASQVLSAIVYQASAQDPVVLGAVGLTVLLTGSLSVAGPVRRALLVDPARLLREE